MGIWDFLLLLLVAAIIGAIGESLGGYSPGGCAMSIVIGFVGAVIGRWLPGMLHLPMFFSVAVGGQRFPVVWSVIGAAILVVILRIVLSRRIVD